MCYKERERQRDPETDGALASLSEQAWRRRPKVENQSALCLPPQGWRLFNTGTANRLVKSTCGSHEASQSSSVHTLARVPGVQTGQNGAGLLFNTFSSAR